MIKSIFKRIGLIVLAVCVAIGSFFVPVTKKQYNSASAADSVYQDYSFTGSSWLTLMVYDNSKYSFINTRIDLNNYSSTNSTDILFYAKSFVTNENSVASYLSYNYVISGVWVNGSYSAYTNPVSNYTLYRVNGELTGDNLWFRLVRSDNQSQALSVRINRSIDFNGNIKSIHIYSEPYSNSNALFGQYFYDLIVIKYIDENGGFLSYSVPTIPAYASDFTDRFYYVNADFTDSQIYNQGYQEGLAANQQNIYNTGYNAGYDIGFGNGVTAGRADANDFSFISLIGAVVDVPLKTFLGLFHFELLGVNLANFILALLTVAFILFIIKLIIGKG